MNLQALQLTFSGITGARDYGLHATLTGALCVSITL